MSNCIIVLTRVHNLFAYSAQVTLEDWPVTADLAIPGAQIAGYHIQRFVLHCLQV